MSSYAASARIVAVRPHLRGSVIDADGVGTSWPEASNAIGGRMEFGLASADIERSGRERAVAGPVVDPINEDLSSWLDRMSTSWSQLTWYLFNPDGWR